MERSKTRGIRAARPFHVDGQHRAGHLLPGRGRDGERIAYELRVRAWACGRGSRQLAGGEGARDQPHKEHTAPLPTVFTCPSNRAPQGHCCRRTDALEAPAALTRHSASRWKGQVTDTCVPINCIFLFKLPDDFGLTAREVGDFGLVREGAVRTATRRTARF